MTHVENHDIISKLSRESTANENNNLKKLLTKSFECVRLKKLHMRNEQQGH